MRIWIEDNLEIYKVRNLAIGIYVADGFLGGAPAYTVASFSLFISQPHCRRLCKGRS